MLIMQKYNKVTRSAKNQKNSKKYWEELSHKDLASIKRLYKQKDHNSLYNWNPEKETFSDTKNIKIAKYIK